ncbi:hypothetical protein RJT34_23715 [Clitoria ternatea]|uniref:Uncharacterized protein n=1 Tax=Clitoria ternatea TaxID=43366 RepID=A0AAN9IIN7_CLITE
MVVRTKRRSKNIKLKVQQICPKRLIHLPFRNQILNRQVHLPIAHFIAGATTGKPEELLQQRNRGGTVARGRLESEEHREAVVADGVRGGIEHVGVAGVFCLFICIY